MNYSRLETCTSHGRKNRRSKRGSQLAAGLSVCSHRLWLRTLPRNLQMCRGVLRSKERSWNGVMASHLVQCVVHTGRNTSGVLIESDGWRMEVEREGEAGQ
jgi:hypothetical protein